MRFEAIGTVWEIDTSTPLSSAMQQRIRKRIDEFDRTYSRFRDDSLVTEMSRRAGGYELPPDARKLLEWYQTLYEATEGAVTPLIGQVLADAGYDAAYSFAPGTLRKPPGWNDVLHYDHPILTLKEPVLLDFGAAGKGYLIDIVADLLEGEGITEFCVDAGGDLVQRSRSGAQLRVGLEHPDDPAMAVGVAGIGNQSICGSAGNRRAWGKFHHIIDPRKLESPRGIAALWAVADNALAADGLTTALFFVPPEELRHRLRERGGPTFEYAVIHADGRLEKSDGFPAEFFTAAKDGVIH